MAKAFAGRPRRLGLLLVGFGHVARRFVRLLDESKEALASLSIDPVVIGIVTKRHGTIIDVAGLDAVLAARRVEQGDAIGPASSSPGARDALKQLSVRNVEARVLVETTVLDIQSGEPAITHVRDGIASGMHVITANKGPVAFAYRALAAEAARANVSFLFEGVVMDGIPIFNLVRETMPGVVIHGFRGVVNSTTNFILAALEKGEAFAPALERMQREGVAEADASLDVDGWDAAAKAAALANVWLDAGITPHDVVREGLTAATGVRARLAVASGKRLKLVAAARRAASGVAATVTLESLDRDDPLAILDGQANALEIDTTPLGRVVITQRDGGLEKTAYALFSDVVTVARRCR